MGMTNIYDQILKVQMNQAKQKMEETRDELNRIVREIKNDPNRSINDEPQAWEKNMELSAAIQKFLRLEKQVMKERSRY